MTDLIEDLIYAARSGDKEEIVKLLATDSIDVNGTNTNGNTALHMASANGHADIVKVLCENKKCNVNLQNESGNTALHWTCLNGNQEVLLSLLSAGADITIENAAGRAAIMEAADRGFDEVVNILAQHGKKFENETEKVEDTTTKMKGMSAKDEAEQVNEKEIGEDAKIEDIF